MPIFSPREVFDDPESALPFLTLPIDDKFEGQHFERKEAGRSGDSEDALKKTIDNLKNHVIKTISAFANSNKEGGLLVLGISKTGEICGTDHLNEKSLNSITDFNNHLVNHAAESKSHCLNVNGEEKTIYLIYSAYISRAICETSKKIPDAWIRSGAQSVRVTQEIRERLRRNKGIVDADNIPVCSFNSEDIDLEVIKEFRNVFHPDSTENFSNERLLYEAGAIVKENDKYWFTLQGLLFFASNPQRILPHAYLRILKFHVPSEQYQNRGTESFDRDFRGSITKQIRNARIFFRETAFFERFQYRKEGGGFSEQPELPNNAIDETIVNALAHRDYDIKKPVEFEHYTDALIVKNPGRIQQQNIDLPDTFNLDEIRLSSMPRNRKLIEWLRLMRDPEGQAFVKALSEGTRNMTIEMHSLRLPPPYVRLNEQETILKLESKAEERKKAFLASIKVPKTAFMNVYPLIITKANGLATPDEVHLRLGELCKALHDSLVAHQWYIDSFSYSRIVAHQKGNDLSNSSNVNEIVRFYPAYCIQIHEMYGKPYLSIDYTCQVLNILKASQISQYIKIETLIKQSCVAKVEHDWRKGRIISVGESEMMIQFFDTNEEEQVKLPKIIPNLSLQQIQTILYQKKINFDINKAIKKYSFASEKSASRKRAEEIQEITTQLSEKIFPVVFGEFTAQMEKKNVDLTEVERRTAFTFHYENLSEPVVEFRTHQKLPNVREGITRYGSYDNNPHNIELIPICLNAQKEQMKSLIERLKSGKYKYHGAEKTFATRFSYPMIITVNNPELIDEEIKRLLSENLNWCENPDLNRLFLVHTPEKNYGYSTDNENSPYFVVKRRLLEAGIPCQMVDTNTINNPDWKDLNLSLNIIAKCGVTPWVLPENIPNADFFVGLSYTQSRSGQKILGFANVFNSYGKWEFYAGNTTAFDFQKKSEYLSELATSVLKRLKNEKSLPTAANLVFHHSVRLSKDDYKAILLGIRKVAPDASVSFVWVNAHNNFRLFDSRAETDGSIQRGSFVPISNRRLLLSTTGYNAYRKALGTPRPLELVGDYYKSAGEEPIACEARTLALQVLNLTKLNWASTDSFSAEPITIKYARDIAYLTAAFIRQREPFELSKVLEQTPWFI